MRPRPFSFRQLGIALPSLVLFASVASGDHHEAGEHGASPTVIQIVTTLVGGKNVYIPSTIVAVAGKPHTLSIFNTTDKPHGFSIEAAGIMEVVPDQIEHEVALPALEAGVYRVHCQLHPAHRAATLLVVEAQSK